MIMRWLVIIVIAVGLFSLPSAARADISGVACVTDGNVIVINGRRSYTRCVGGTPVRLFGIVAPELDQLCPAPGGRQWTCGRAAAAMLLEAVKGKAVVCRGSSNDVDGRLMAVCYVDDVDINQKMVHDGWALAYPLHSDKYQADEATAAQSRRGLWQVSGNAEFEWRNR